MVLKFSHFTLPRTPSNPAGLSSGTFDFSLHKRPHRNPPTHSVKSRWLAQRYLRFLTTQATVQEPQRTPSKSRWLVQRYFGFSLHKRLPRAYPRTPSNPAGLPSGSFGFSLHERPHQTHPRALPQIPLACPAVPSVSNFTSDRTGTHPRTLSIPLACPAVSWASNYTSEGSEVSTGQAGGIILCAVSPRFSRKPNNPPGKPVGFLNPAGLPSGSR